MEKECANGIKTAESILKEEFKTYWDEVEKNINTYKQNNNIKDALSKIIQKTLHDRARER